MPSIMANPASRKTLILGAIALLLAGLTVYDYSAGPDKGALGRLTDERHAGAKAENEDSPLAAAKKLGELRFLVKHSDEIKARYPAIAAAYAESIATFATILKAGESPANAAKKALRSLLAPEVKLDEVLVSEVPYHHQGALWLTVNLSLSSHDSAAFSKTLVALGDASNGMVWQKLNMLATPDQSALQATGQLAMLMVENVE